MNAVNNIQVRLLREAIEENCRKPGGQLLRMLASQIATACGTGETHFFDISARFDDEDTKILSAALALGVATGKLFMRQARDGCYYRAAFQGPGVDIDAVHRGAA